MNRLQKKYKTEVLPALQKQFGYTNSLAVPKITRVVVNASFGKLLQSEPKAAELVAQTLARITGQRAVMTKAKKSISNFKIRQGQVIGAMVTLRGERMYEFLDKLIASTLPRVRDFRGLKLSAFDGRGNYSIGIQEHMVFPEIRSDEVEKLYGLEVNIATSAKHNDEGRALLAGLGLPFVREPESAGGKQSKAKSIS